MKPGGPLLFLAAGLWGAATAAEPGLVSSDTKAKILEGLPKFDAAAAQAARDNPEAAPAPATEPGVLVLPKMTIKERRLPADAEDHLMRPKDFQRKMENIYLDEVAKDGELNYLLNSFTIPFLSPSKAARGHAIYRRRELQRLMDVNAATRSLDEKSAKAVQDEFDRATREPAPWKVIK